MNEKRRKSRRRSIALANKADEDVIPSLSEETANDKECIVERMLPTISTAGEVDADRSLVHCSALRLFCLEETAPLGSRKNVAKGVAAIDKSENRRLALLPPAAPLRASA